MEPKGRGKRLTDQLQGAAVQDQAVQSKSAAEAVQSQLGTSVLTDPSVVPHEQGVAEKVVVQLGTKTVKGYLESPAWESIEELPRIGHESSLELLSIRHAHQDKTEEVPAKNVKAIFFVNSFEGNSRHKHLNFHSRVPVVDGIWMRVQFLDGEVMEGIVYNSLRYLVDPGFFLLPTDPGSNNKLVYVLKSWLADHRILGIRKI